MQTDIHHIQGKQIAELISEAMVITTAEHGTDLVGTLCFEGMNGIILYQKNITPRFFDLKTGMAGEVLQKCSTYRMRLAIVGDFENVAGQSLKDFIRESNKLGHVNFVGSREEALERLGRG